MGDASPRAFRQWQNIDLSWQLNSARSGKNKYITAKKNHSLFTPFSTGSTHRHEHITPEYSIAEIVRKLDLSKTSACICRSYTPIGGRSIDHKIAHSIQKWPYPLKQIVSSPQLLQNFPLISKMAGYRPLKRELPFSPIQARTPSPPKRKRKWKKVPYTVCRRENQNHYTLQQPTKQKRYRGGFLRRSLFLTTISSFLLPPSIFQPVQTLLSSQLRGKKLTPGIFNSPWPTWLYSRTAPTLSVIERRRFRRCNLISLCLHVTGIHNSFCTLSIALFIITGASVWPRILQTKLSQVTHVFRFILYPDKVIECEVTVRKLLKTSFGSSGVILLSLCVGWLENAHSVNLFPVPPSLLPAST